MTTDLLIILIAGLVAGIAFRALGGSPLVGYLLVGAAIGDGGLRLAGAQQHEVHTFAEVGALLLLFAVGIEFSPDKLLAHRRAFFVGGAVQMVLSAVVLALVARAAGFAWNAACLIGVAAALSSTVLVFRALYESGQSNSAHGLRALGVLLFQDAALVPLLLITPMLAGEGPPPTVWAFVKLIGATAFFTIGVLAARFAFIRWTTPLLAGLRSVELVVLFAVAVLGVACLAAVQLGLPLAIGALAAGLALSGQRLSKQIDAVLLPFREVFAAIFFVSLGMLMRPGVIFSEPLLHLLGVFVALLVKGLAGAAALWIVGLRPRAALGMGFGLAQLGEFSFLLMAQAAASGVVAPADYSRFLGVALGTLLVTPWLLSLGLRLAATEESEPAAPAANQAAEPLPHAVVIGVGPIGRQVACRLETEGVEVALVDLSPVNLYAFEQSGFHTVQGNAREPEVLQRAGVARAGLVTISVPDDQAALEIVRRTRQMAPRAAVAVRCRYESNAGPLARAGADEVVSEESEAAGRLLAFCERRLGISATH